MSVFAFSGGLSQFEQWWQLQGEWVEEPNQRRGGESGVQRLQVDQGQLLYAKRQVGHLCRSLSHPFGRPTVLRERDALLGLSRLGIRVPRLVYCGATRPGATATGSCCYRVTANSGAENCRRWVEELRACAVLR